MEEAHPMFAEATRTRVEADPGEVEATEAAGDPEAAGKAGDC